MGVARVVPPNSSSTTPWARRSCFTFCTFAVGRSILLMATTSGTPAFFACEIASIVRGLDEDDDIGHLGAAGAHRRERLVARRVQERDGAPAVFHRHLIGPDVLGDPAGLARDDAGFADIVEQRGLAVVHMTHDGDDRRPRLERLGTLGLALFRCRRDVLLLALGLEPERRSDQLDHVEVEPLVDRDHLAELLERKGDDLGGRDLEDVGELGHRDELGDPDQGLLTLLFFATLLLLQVAEARTFLAMADAFTADGALDRRQGARDVLRHRLLVHRRLTALLALLALVAAALVQRDSPGGGGGDRSRRHGAARRGARHGLGAHRRGDERPGRRRLLDPGAFFDGRQLLEQRGRPLLERRSGTLLLLHGLGGLEGFARTLLALRFDRRFGLGLRFGDGDFGRRTAPAPRPRVHRGSGYR